MKFESARTGHSDIWRGCEFGRFCALWLAGRAQKSTLASLPVLGIIGA